MDALTPPRTLVERAYEAILDAICDGTLEPGERLTQDDVARRLKVSRQPITNALAMLKAHGFVREAGGRGVVVAPLEGKRFDDIYQYRSAVEPLAVRLAIPRLTKADIKLGRAMIEKGQAKAAQGNARELLRADMDFHFFIYHLADNSLILETMRLNWHHLRRAMREVIRTPQFPVSIWTEHAAVFEAMAEGDANEAARVMQDHITRAHKQVQPLLAAGTL